MSDFFSKIKDHKLVLIAAPICGYTRFPFRRILSQFPVDLVFTEMVSIDALHYENPNTNPIFYHETLPVKAGIQIFGSKIPYFIEAVEKIERMKLFDVIDINMGCPVKKVIKAGGGSALLENPEHIYQILSTLSKQFSHLFFSAKIRIGLTKSRLNYPEVSHAVEQGGARMLTVHGRTKCQIYSGEVNFEAIAKIREFIKIPVIGNGGLFTPEDAKKMLEYTKCDGLMPARGMFGNPWLFQQIHDFLTTGVYHLPTIQEKLAMFTQHFNYEIHFDPANGFREYKKIGMRYLSGLKYAAELRKDLVNCHDLESMISFVKNLSELDPNEQKLK